MNSQMTNGSMPRINRLGTEQGGITRLLDTHVPPLPVTRALDEAVHPPAADDAQRITGFGEPLIPGLRLWAEQTFGVDLENVRIHDDQESHDQADQQDAEALTYGNDILFSKGSYKPGNPEGDSLIAHELTHAAGQSTPGAQATVQRNGHGRRGIGSAPPSESYIPMEGTESEDGFVLFDQNRINLDSTDTQTIRQLVSQHAGTGPATVHVHGYASREGDETYNENLSAHRGVAVKTFLEGILPEGSQVTVFAYGNTTDFGDLADNRRVGIDFLQRQDPLVLNPGFTPNLDIVPDLHLNTDFSELEFYRRMLDLQGTQPSEDISPEQLDRESITPSSESIMREPPELPEPTVDHPSLTPLYGARGVSRDYRDAEASQDHFIEWYRRFVLWGFSSDQAAWLSNKGTNFLVGNQLSYEHPTRQESLDRQFGTEITGASLSLDFDPAFWILNQRRYQRR